MIHFDREKHNKIHFTYLSVHSFVVTVTYMQYTLLWSGIKRCGEAGPFAPCYVEPGV